MLEYESPIRDRIQPLPTPTAFTLYTRPVHDEKLLVQGYDP